MKFSTGGGSKAWENPEPGAVSGVLIKVIDQGTQKTTFNGEEKFAHKVMFTFELESKMSDGKPHIISTTFTASMHEKAALRKFLEGWRGKQYTQQEAESIEPKKLLGQAAMLTLVEKGEYVNISSASKLPKGLMPIKPENDFVYFSLYPGEFDQQVFDSLSDKLKEKIMSTPEYKLATADSIAEEEDVF